MAVQLGDKIAQIGSGTYKLVDAHDINVHQATDGTGDGIMATTDLLICDTDAAGAVKKILISQLPFLDEQTIGVADDNLLEVDDADGLAVNDYTKVTANGLVGRTYAQVLSDIGGQASGNYITALTGEVTATGPGSVAATIAADAVTYAKMQNVSATDKLLGRETAGAGDVEEIACTAAGRALLDDVTADDQLTTLGLSQNLGDLTDNEAAQLENIGATTISANQWAAVGSMAETLIGAELNILDGVTATATELNYLDLTTLGTAQASKALTIAAGSTWTVAGMTCADLGIVTTVDINGGTIDGITSLTSTGLLGVTVAGNTAVLQNTTDAASNQVAQLKAGNRATSANDDSGYISLFCDNDAGTQMEMVRLKWIIAQDDADSEEGALDIQLESSGGGDLQSILYLRHSDSTALFDAQVKAQQFWAKDGTTGNYLKIVAGTNEYNADWQLNIDLDNADRSLRIAASVFLDQDLDTSSSPTFAGLTLSGAFTFSGANPDIIGGDTDGALSITADTATNQGGNIKLYGNTHGSLAQDIEFYADATLVLSWDESEGNWDFASQNVKGIGTIGCGAITTTGIFSVDHIAENTGAHNIVLDNNLDLPLAAPVIYYGNAGVTDSLNFKGRGTLAEGVTFSAVDFANTLALTLSSTAATFQTAKILSFTSVDETMAFSATTAGKSITLTSDTIYLWGSVSLGANQDVVASGSAHITSGSEGFIVGATTLLEGSLDIGDAGGFTGIKFNAATTEIEFWVDGNFVSNINATGEYTDETP